MTRVSKVYMTKVKEELESNRDIHKEQIRQMQELIRAGAYRIEYADSGNGSKK